MPDSRKTFLDLSLTQIIGSSLAAATAAYAGSRIGVMGTILGASMASLISAVAGAAYTESLRRTSALVRQRSRALDADPPNPLTRGEAAANLGDTTELPVVPDPEPTPGPPTRRLRWTHVAAAAGVVFALTAGVVTGVELVTGRSLDGSKGTTVEHVVKPNPTPTPANPTPTPTSTPTKPAATDTPSATPTPTPSEAPSPTTTPSTTPTASATPTP